MLAFFVLKYQSYRPYWPYFFGNGRKKTPQGVPNSVRLRSETPQGVPSSFRLRSETPQGVPNSVRLRSKTPQGVSNSVRLRSDTRSGDYRHKKRSLTVKLSSGKEIRHRTTLPQSNMQYHRRWAPYRSCSGWERELQARHGHRKKRIKDVRFMSVELSGRQANSKLGNCDFVRKRSLVFFSFKCPGRHWKEKKVVKPHDRLVMLS